MEAIGSPARRVTDTQCAPHATKLYTITSTLRSIHSKTMMGGAKQIHNVDLITTLFSNNLRTALKHTADLSS